jgi:AcrR family transcriptional regulator
VTTPAPVPDGRSARSQRTREAVVDALLALIRDGNPRPTAREIADRANISLRSVYVHFDDLEDLFLVSTQRQMARINALIEPVPPSAPLEQRVELVCNMRARIFEEFGSVRRAAWLQTPCSKTLSDLMEHVRTASRDGLGEVFRTELASLPREERARRLAVLDAMMSGESWDLLRTTHDLSVEDSCVAMANGALALLRATDGAGA